MNIFKKTFLVLNSLLLFACGGGGGSGGGGGDEGNSQTSSNGFLSAAPVDGATCDLYKVVNNSKSGVSLQTVSSNAGVVEFEKIDYSGIALIECTGGSYTDEATNGAKIPPTLRSVVNFNSAGFAVTPLTEIAVQMDTNLSNVLSTHNAVVAKVFGMEGINISTIKPTDIDNENIADNSAGRYATALATLSQLEKDNSGEGATLNEIITSLKTDLSDGKLDSDTSSRLTKSIENLTTSIFKHRLNDAVITNLKGNIFLNAIDPQLNDTGIVWGGDFPTGNNSTCTGHKITAQDCSHGRDAKARLGILSLLKVGGGVAGFDFTKLGSNGSPITIQNQSWTSGGTGTESAGTKWSCIRDNVTGLVWEIKTDNGSQDNDTTNNTHTNIHHKDNKYRWGGKTAIGKTHSSKEGNYYNDWTGLVDGSNSEQLCGFNNWKVPTINELDSIVHKGESALPIDNNFFPNTQTQNGYFWTASPDAVDSLSAWQLQFNDGGLDIRGIRNSNTYVRLVRSGQ